jgi:hypothetical protein
MAKYSEDRAKQFPFRLGEDLHELLKASASANSRSMNAEIIRRLEASFEPARELAPAINDFIEKAIEKEVKARLQSIAAQIAK